MSKEDVLNALYSGNYKQAHGALRDGDSFCALGVICDAYIKKHGGSWEWECGKWVCSVDGGGWPASPYQMPAPVAEWAFGDMGKAGSPRLKLPSGRARATISELNDRGYSLAEIALILESEENNWLWSE